MNHLITAAGSKEITTYYSGKFVYEDNRLLYIIHSEGKVDMSSGTPVYQFYLKDHLGNVQVMTDLSGNLQQVMSKSDMKISLSPNIWLIYH